MIGMLVDLATLALFLALIAAWFALYTQGGGVF